MYRCPFINVELGIGTSAHQKLTIISSPSQPNKSLRKGDQEKQDR